MQSKPTRLTESTNHPPITASQTVAAAVLLMLALKGSLHLAGRAPFNSDEAIVALMARHILGGARPVFFYGQAYMGSLDAFLAAGGFAIFGEQVWVIRLVQALLYAATLLTTARLGRAIFGKPWAGALAALLLAIPTVNVTLYTTVSLGGYGEALLIGNLILLASLNLRKRIVAGERAVGLWLGWGFLAGLGVWVFGLTLIYSLPSGIYLLVSLWRTRQAGKYHSGGGGSGVGQRLIDSILPAVLGGMLGAAPWLWFAWQQGVAALLGELGGGAIAGVEGLPWLQATAQHVLSLFLLGFTVIFGLRPPWNTNWLAWPLLPLALAFWMAVVGYTAAQARRQYEPQAERWLLLGVGLTLIVVFIVTPFGADPSGRYFVPLAIPLALFGGAFLEALARRRRWLAGGLLAIVLAFNLWGTVQCALRYPPGLTTQFHAPTQIDHTYDAELIAFLRNTGATTGYTNYWVAYPLAFLSQEQLIFIPRLPYHTDLRYTSRDDRYPAYTARVEAADRTAYITTHNPALDNLLRQGFTGLGVTWQEATIGDYQIYYSLSRPVRPAELGLGN